MMEAQSTSENSINFCETTWCNIPEDGMFLDSDFKHEMEEER
jgi:hypothetical protein